jgi:hypothetical protein
MAYHWRSIQITHYDVESVIDHDIRPKLVEFFNSVKNRQYPQLQRRYVNDPRTLNKKVDELLNAKLRGWEAEHKPVFLLFAPDMFDDRKLAAIRSCYPSLTFFLLAGSAAKEPPVPNAELLVPSLPPDGEEQAQRRYDELWDRIPAS